PPCWTFVCPPGKYFRTCFISSATCGSGAKGGLGGLVSPTRKRVLSLGMGRLAEAASIVSELPVDSVTSSIQKCGCGSGTIKVSKFNPYRLSAGNTMIREPGG